VGKSLERDVIGIMSATLAIVVLIVLVENAGGVGTILTTFFNGWNSLLATLTGRGSYARAA
jgi:hypothetical protein